MIKYNWENLKKYSNNDISKILEYLTNVYVLKGTMYDYLLKHKWAVNVYEGGDNNSYLLGVDAFISNDLNATPEEQFVYLDLASKRSIFTYFNTKGKVTFLPIWRAKEYYNINTLKTNRLLMIDSDNIYLVYEGED